MMRIYMLASIVLVLACNSKAVTFSSHARCAIVLPEEASLAEQTAAKDLAHYLGKATGCILRIVPESAIPARGQRIYVGRTNRSRSMGVDTSRLGEERWIIKADKNDLLLAGAYPRGIMYATYIFLEKHVGVRWWNPLEEHIPSHDKLVIGPLDEKGDPAFRHRALFLQGYLSVHGFEDREYGPGAWAARNRMNMITGRIPATYGGMFGYGPPYNVHTLHHYFPNRQYGKTHPEWFSLVDGKRMTVGLNQLCLSTRELRDAAVGKMAEYIELDIKNAKIRGGVPSRMFSLTFNDWENFCECKPCQALVRKLTDIPPGEVLFNQPGFNPKKLNNNKINNGYPGLIDYQMDFVNYVAERIGKQHPEVLIHTLAYMNYVVPPVKLSVPDNVVIHYCKTEAQAHCGRLFPLTYPRNKEFVNKIRGWRKKAKRVMTWGYNLAAAGRGIPIPDEFAFLPDAQFHEREGLMGMFTQFTGPYPFMGDMLTMKMWLWAKAIENPNADMDELLKTFTDGYYGAAGPMMMDYRKRLHERVENHPRVNKERGYWGMMNLPYSFVWMRDVDFLKECYDLFEQAEAKVESDPVLRRRLRTARHPLHRSLYTFWPQLMEQWKASDPSHTEGNFPFDLDQALAEYEQTMAEGAAMWCSRYPCKSVFMNWEMKGLTDPGGGTVTTYDHFMKLLKHTMTFLGEDAIKAGKTDKSSVLYVPYSHGYYNDSINRMIFNPEYGD